MGRKTAGQPEERHTAQRARPSPAKPSPPVFDCSRCSKLSTLRRRVNELEQAESARAAAAIAGVPVCLNDAQVEEAISGAKRQMAAHLKDIANRQVDIATSPRSTDADATRSGAWVFDRVAGPVKQQLALSGEIGLTCSDVYVHPAEDPEP